MTLRRAPKTLATFRLPSGGSAFLGYAEGSLAVLIATLFSQRAHRAGLPEYLTLYPLAVATVSALWGIRHGLFAALLAVILTRVALVPDGGALLPPRAECIRFAAISFSTFAAAALVGIVREQRNHLERSARALSERQAQLVAAHEALRLSEARREAFIREIVLTVSHGKLRLSCLDDLCLGERTPVLQADLTKPADVSALRHAVADVGRSIGMDRERVEDLSICLGEAATNAVVHAGGGRAAIYADDETLWMLISDTGPGIDQDELPRATLLKGYSTTTSLGMGFSIMLDLADSVCLCTGEGGTHILLEMGVVAPTADPLDLALLGVTLDRTWDAASTDEG